MPRERNICFVTGTRAEFGLMRSVLVAIRKRAGVKLQLVATGMHLDPAHGDGVRSIMADGWTVDCVIPWSPGAGKDRQTTACNTGLATAALSDAFAELESDIVLVVGDRVEAFAAATAAHLSGRVVAHVHGGDRAAGQADDCLRHAISKLAHVHFAATAQSAARLRKLGEDGWRIHRVGSPGLDDILATARSANEISKSVGGLKSRRYAIVLLHPVDSDEAAEARRARLVLRAAEALPYEKIVVIYPNNDPGSGGIIRTWNALDDPRIICKRDLPRAVFLGLLRDAAALVGNSSSGIIEAASFGTPSVDVGPRQQGREHGSNVFHVPYVASRIRSELQRLWNDGRPRRFGSKNIYGNTGTGRRIAGALSRLKVDGRLLRKLICY